MQFFEQLMLMGTLNMAVHLKCLLKLSLVLNKLFSFCWYVVQMLDDGIFSVEKHDKHGHGFNVLLWEVGVLEFDEIVFVVNFKAASFGAETIQKLLLCILVIWLIKFSQIGDLWLYRVTFWVNCAFGFIIVLSALLKLIVQIL